MKTKKQQLIENPQQFSNESDLLECNYSQTLQKFCLLFNSKLYTYKTWNGYIAKRNYFIDKYNLNIN